MNKFRLFLATPFIFIGDVMAFLVRLITGLPAAFVSLSEMIGEGGFRPIAAEFEEQVESEIEALGEDADDDSVNAIIDKYHEKTKEMMRENNE